MLSVKLGVHIKVFLGNPLKYCLHVCRVQAFLLFLFVKF